MNHTISLHITHPSIPPGPIEGFALLWAFYVRGFRPEKHCQECFVGELATSFHSRNHASGVEIRLDQTDEFRFVYVCGVAKGPESARRCTNLHFPLKFEAGSRAEITTYNGYHIVAENAVHVPIPDLAERWRGLPDVHARWKNFRFGVEYFGANGVGLT
jgi:hypothetical protein